MQQTFEMKRKMAQIKKGILSKPSDRSAGVGVGPSAAAGSSSTMKGSSTQRNKKVNKKKRDQELWDDVLKAVRTHSREFSLPTQSDGNPVIQLFERMAEEQGPFPPKQVIVAQRLEHPWAKVLMQSLLAPAVLKYSATFMDTHKYQGITSLCFWGASLNDIGAQHVAESLPLLPHCHKLEILDCGIGPKACESLAVALRKRKTAWLKILRLEHNNQIGSAGVRALADGLYYNSMLQSLSLAYCAIPSDGGAILAEILTTQGVNITHLNVEGNQLGREGIIALSQGIARNRTLTTLNVAINEWGGEVDLKPIEAITKALQLNTGLHHINMDGNVVGDVGAQYMLDAFATCTHIWELQVSPFMSPGLYQAIDEMITRFKPKPVKKKIRRKKKPNLPWAVTRATSPKKDTTLTIPTTSTTTGAISVPTTPAASTLVASSGEIKT